MVLSHQATLAGSGSRRELRPAKQLLLSLAGGRGTQGLSEIPRPSSEALALWVWVRPGIWVSQATQVALLPNPGGHLGICTHLPVRGVGA